MLSREKIRQLSEQEFKDNYVVSLFLDVDPERHPSRKDLQSVLNSLINQANDKIEQLGKNDSLSHEQRQSLAKDLESIREYVVYDFNREKTPGIAFFSSKRAGLWDIERLPHSVKNRVVINRGPYVRPLLRMLDDYKHFFTLLISKDKARLFRIFAEQIKDESDIFDVVPGKHEQGGWSQKRYQRHIEDHIDQHLKHVSSKLERFFAENPFDYLVISTTDEVRPMIEHRLHPYLKQHLIKWENLEIDALDQAVLDRTIEVEHGIIRKEQQDLVEKAKQRKTAGSLIAIGLENVLTAVREKRVETLLVRRGFSQKGFKSYNCKNLSLNDGNCEICGEKMSEVDDVVEEAIENTYNHNGAVRLINNHIDMSEFDSIAALLAY
jgi:peptide chain release factor subunit 1